MRISIAGGHGKIAMRLGALLSESGHEAVGLVRDPGQLGDLAAVGVRGVVCDLEDANVVTVAGHIAGSDAAVFAAGAGPGSGTARKDTVDRGASALLADACEQANVDRYLQISAMGAGSPPPEGTDEVFAAYLVAKTAAEEDLMGRDLQWTILRPGGLTDDPGTGRVRLAPPPVPRGRVTRDDVAAVIAAMLASPYVGPQVLDLTNGDASVPEAVAAVAQATWSAG